MSTSSSVFRERLLPGGGALATAVGLGVLTAIILIPVQPVVAAVAAVLVAAAGVCWLVLAAPVITVDGGVLHAGRAHIPVTLLGTASVIGSRDAMREELGGRLDARAHVLLRSWIPTGVRVTLVDPADVTPYWLLSTRRPDELAAALGASRQDASGRDEPGTAKAATPET
jgi:hypothetical protein